MGRANWPGCCCGPILTILICNEDNPNAYICDVDKATAILSNKRTITVASGLPSEWLPVGLRQDPISKTVYFWNDDALIGGQQAGYLYSLNTTTGVANRIGGFGLTGSAIEGDLCFNPTDNTCYCVYENTPAGNYYFLKFKLPRGKLPG